MALRHVIDRTRRLAAGEAADAALPALFEWFLAEPDRTRRLLNAVRGLGHRTRADRLPPALAQQLYGDPLRVNAYQLEAFLACPFRHFAAYGLRLAPEVSPEPDAARRGALIHDALHAFVDQHRQNIERWRSMTDEEAVESMRAVLAEVLERPQAGPWRRTAVRRELAARVESVLAVAAIVLTRHVRHGSFVPHSLEVSFADQPSDELPPFTVTLSDGERVEVRGRVDRIDVAEQNGRRAFRVVDYKSGDKRLDLTEVEHGISLQLPLYAAVVGRHSDRLFGSAAEPAGIVVQPVALKLDVKDVPDDERSARAAAIQQLGARAWLVDDRTLVGWMDARLMDGGRTELFPQIYRKDGTPAKNAPLFEGAHWRRLLGRVVRHVRDAAERMRAGDIAIAPYRLDKEQPCTYCPYAAVCQIDKRWDPTPIRRLEKGDRDHWLERWRVFETEEGQV
jgi:ATP-dependent helicase/nuclease subunit B